MTLELEQDRIKTGLTLILSKVWYVLHNELDNILLLWLRLSANDRI